MASGSDSDSTTYVAELEEDLRCAAIAGQLALDREAAARVSLQHALERAEDAEKVSLQLRAALERAAQRIAAQRGAVATAETDAYQLRSRLQSERRDAEHAALTARQRAADEAAALRLHHAGSARCDSPIRVGTSAVSSSASSAVPARGTLLSSSSPGGPALAAVAVGVERVDETVLALRSEVVALAEELRTSSVALDEARAEAEAMKRSGTLRLARERRASRASVAKLDEVSTALAQLRQEAAAPAPAPAAPAAAPTQQRQAPPSPPTPTVSLAKTLDQELADAAALAGALSEVSALRVSVVELRTSLHEARAETAVERELSERRLRAEQTASQSRLALLEEETSAQAIELALLEEVSETQSVELLEVAAAAAAAAATAVAAKANAKKALKGNQNDDENLSLSDRATPTGRLAVLQRKLQTGIISRREYEHLAPLIQLDAWHEAQQAPVVAKSLLFRCLRSVTVANVTRVGSGASAYAQYELNIRIAPRMITGQGDDDDASSRVFEWTVRRRFSEFRMLHINLAGRVGGRGGGEKVAKLLPRFPRSIRRLGGRSMKDSVLERRRVALDAYIAALIAQVRVGALRDRGESARALEAEAMRQALAALHRQVGVGDIVEGGTVEAIEAASARWEDEASASASAGGGDNAEGRALEGNGEAILELFVSFLELWRLSVGK